MSFLELRRLEKSFGQQRIVRGVDLAVARGEFVSLLGPSGCGKTTTLRMIAGFETPDTGDIRVEGRDVTGLRPRERRIGMVFQSYALFPNMTVADNIGFGLRIAGLDPEARRRRVEEMLALVRLEGLGGRFPFQLSGGQQQRVALARALAPRPALLLLDEPLSALDAKIRVSLRDEIKSVQRTLGITTIYVTHDQEEALSMSDRVVVMAEGRIEQAGPPHEIYNFPATPFVASFVGTLNLLEAEVVDPGLGRVRIDGQEIATTRPIPMGLGGRPATVALRPEALTIVGKDMEAATATNALSGTVDDVSFLGSIVRVRVRLGRQRLSVDTFNNPGLAPPAAGTAVEVAFAPADVLVLAESN